MAAAAEREKEKKGEKEKGTKCRIKDMEDKIEQNIIIFSLSKTYMSL